MTITAMASRVTAPQKLGLASKPPSSAPSGASKGARSGAISRGTGHAASRHGVEKLAILPGHAYAYPIPCPDEKSPRLMPLDDGAIIAYSKPLLPEVDEHPQERFCIEAGIEVAGLPQSRSVVVDYTLSFPQVVARMEASVRQAVLLLNDRLRTLQLRSRKLWFSDLQSGEMCDIAMGVAAAAYHLQKWASSFPSSGLDKPKKPFLCEDREEAFAVIQSASPRLLVACAAAHKGMSSVIKEQAEKAEEVINRKGISTQDIRAIAPHLECLIGRISRLSSRLHSREPMRDFVSRYFTPAFGWRPARLIGHFADDYNEAS